MTPFNLILSQRANATVDYFAYAVRLMHVFTKMFPKHNAGSPTHRLEYQFYRGRVSFKNEMHDNLLVFGM